MAPDDPAARHTPFDDAQALVTGALFVAFGLTLFRSAGLLSGGTAGVAFLVHYASGWPFGPVFFAVNLPFYVLAWRTFGRAFTLKTFAAVALVAVAVEAIPRLMAIERIDAWFAAVMGGCAVGVGLLMLFRHRASLGGLNVLALMLQEKRGWRAGRVQMALDVAIVAAALAIVEPWRVALSVLGAIALNLVVAVNHRPGRYLAA